MQYLILITVILGVLKLAGYISISWLLVLAPLMIGFGLLFVITLFFPFLVLGSVFFFGVLTSVTELIFEYIEDRRSKHGEDFEGKTN